MIQEHEMHRFIKYFMLPRQIPNRIWKNCSVTQTGREMTWIHLITLFQISMRVGWVPEISLPLCISIHSSIRCFSFHKTHTYTIMPTHLSKSPRRICSCPHTNPQNEKEVLMSNYCHYGTGTYWNRGPVRLTSWIEIGINKSITMMMI